MGVRSNPPGDVFQNPPEPDDDRAHGPPPIHAPHKAPASPISTASAEGRRSATVNPPVVVFDGWRFARTSNAMGAHDERI
jgi:hypothetical protein